MVDKKVKKEIEIKDLTICESTQQMLAKAKRDGVSTAFDRAIDMKACPIGADSACCKHCAMGPCRLNARDPYGKVGVCGATIDTIMARNFRPHGGLRCAAHTDHGMSMLDLFREVVNGQITDYEIKDTIKLESWPRNRWGSKPKASSQSRRSPLELYANWKEPTPRWKAKFPLHEAGARKTLETWRKHGPRTPRGHAGNHGIMHRRTWVSIRTTNNITKQCSRTALADGWGGSMVATEISDILFGTPTPVSHRSQHGRAQGRRRSTSSCMGTSPTCSSP
jgi:carbon-monoxide dehydrogenase catalytic subunit